MVEGRAFCPHCYAPVIAGRKSCPKCGRNVSDAPTSTSKRMRGPAVSGGTAFAVLGALVVVLAAASWFFLR